MSAVTKAGGVEKAKARALKVLREECLNSFAWKLCRATRMVDRADADCLDSASLFFSEQVDEKARTMAESLHICERISMRWRKIRSN